MAVRGKHRTIAVDVDAEAPPEPKHWPVPWWLAAALGPLAVLGGGFLLLAALAAAGWLTAPDASFSSAMLLAGRLLVLAHGAPVDIGGLLVSIAPLGISILLIFLSLPLAGFAARQLATQSGVTDDTGAIWADTDEVMVKAGGTFAAVYTGLVMLCAVLVGSAGWRPLIGGITIGVVAGLWGAARAMDHDPTERWPGWLRAVPRAMLAALLVVLVGAAAALAAALFTARYRVTDLVAGLEPDAVGMVLLVAIHLAYLPNLLLGAASWVLGAGVTVGDGSLITVTTSHVGLLPAVPAFGIVPEPGTAPPVMLSWLAVGALAGIVAAVAVAWARPRARFDETALVGGLAGVLAGLLIAVVCALGAGGLGVDRLAQVGAREVELLIFAPTILGLSGLLAGLVLGLIRRPAKPASPDAEDAADEPVLVDADREERVVLTDGSED